MELDRAKKPCLKAVLQGDASAARPMVLCVSRVYTAEEVGGRHGRAAAIIEVGVCARRARACFFFESIDLASRLIDEEWHRSCVCVFACA